MPEYLSDDEEERFVKRADLDEREMYYRAANKDKERYNKQDMWESREPFFFTYEVCNTSVSHLAHVSEPSLIPASSSVGKQAFCWTTSSTSLEAG